jgi:uncharacterized protein
MTRDTTPIAERTDPGARRRGPARRLIATLALAPTLLMSALWFVVALPDHILFSQRMAFSILDMDAERELVALDQHTHDGLVLRSWFMAPQEGRPTIFYFAGRDGDIIRKPAHLLDQVREGFGLVLVGYRGYGGNPGFPSETDMQRDAQGLIHEAQRLGLTDGGSIFYGYSMGSAFAAHAGAMNAASAVILEAPISTFLAAVRQQAGRVPAFLVRTRLDNLSRLPQIQAPILLLAGGMDAVTPPAFAHALAQSNPAHARVELIKEANHLNIIRLGGRQIVAGFLREIVKGGGDGAAEELTAGQALQGQPTAPATLGSNRDML